MNKRKAPSHLRRIHPSSDLKQLQTMPLDLLRKTLYVARDIYHGGDAIAPRDAFAPMERHRMIEEILMLRARFMRLPQARREALEVGHSSEVTYGVISQVPVDTRQ